ncbi:hypothetical protein ACWFRK_11955 [Streptomyces sp. NPDC055157]
MADQKQVRDPFWDGPWGDDSERLAANATAQRAGRAALVGIGGLLAVVVLAAAVAAALAIVALVIVTYTWMTAVA